MPPFDRRRLPDDAVVATWTAHDGWPVRTVTLPSSGPREGRGNLLFAGGLGDFVEKGLEPMAHWRARGWTVRSWDWRGQGRSGRLGPADVAHVGGFDDHVRDAIGFIAEAQAGRPVVAVGHSMGGHLILRALVGGARVDAAVLSAPMLGIRSGPLPAAVAGWIAGGVARAVPERGVFSAVGHVDRRGRFATTVLTSSVERFADEGWWREVEPDLGSGPPSWGWLAAAYRSMRMLTPRVLAGVETPMLLLASPRDKLVSTPAIRRAAQALPNAELVVVPGAAHELLREADGPRGFAMRAIDRFLEARVPSP